MTITIITVGKKTEQNLADIVGDYTDRISRYMEVYWQLIPSMDKIAEGVAILKKINKSDFVVALDGNSKEMTTPDLAIFLNKRMVSGDKNLTFIIGGSYGLDTPVIERADLVWSLSKLTFPHQLVRLILSETLYRAISVIKNEPYHH